MTKKEIKQRHKPWISNEILKLMQKRDKVNKLKLNAKDDIAKDLYFKKYKILRNQIVALSRKSKKQYYQNYFTQNSDNLRNTWRGIKSIINMDGKDKSNPTSLLIDKDLVTDPTKVANEFNNYFSNIAGKLQASIHSQGQDFNNYLHNKSEHCLFIQPTDKYEIINTINNLSNKASGPNSIPMFYIDRNRHQTDLLTPL